MTRAFRIPLQDADRDRLAELLKDVPVETLVRHDWRSEPGRLFIKELRKLQVSGVPANWIAEALGLTTSTINGALNYWERLNTRNPRGGRRRRTPRPLRPTQE